MKTIVFIFGIILTLAGIWLLVSPNALFEFIEGNREELWLYISGISARLILGFSLVKTAPQTIRPIVAKIMGYLVMLAAVYLIVIGHEDFQELVTSLISYFGSYGQWISIAVIVFGGYLIRLYLPFFLRSKSTT